MYITNKYHVKFFFYLQSGHFYKFLYRKISLYCISFLVYLFICDVFYLFELQDLWKERYWLEVTISNETITCLKIFRTIIVDPFYSFSIHSVGRICYEIRLCLKLEVVQLNLSKTDIFPFGTGWGRLKTFCKVLY